MRLVLIISALAAIAVLGAYALQQREAPPATNDPALRREVEELRTEVRKLRADRDARAARGVASELGEPAATAPTSNTPKRRKITCERSDTTMPDLRGMDVQLAQDTMQAMDVWAFLKHDATEKNRVMLWDRNWIVVRQDPRPCMFVDGRTTVSVWGRKRGD